MSILARGLRLRVRWNGWASIRLTLSKQITPRSGNYPGISRFERVCGGGRSRYRTRLCIAILC